MSQVRRMANVLVLLLVGTLAGGMLWKPLPPQKFAGLTSGEIPRMVSGYRAPTDNVIGDDVRRQLAAATPVSRTYVRGADAIDFLMIGGTDRAVLHDPRSCYLGAGWQLADYHTERVPGAAISAQSCRAVGLPGTENRDILYFYYQDGRIIDRATDIRLAMLESALLGRADAPVYFLEFGKSYPGPAVGTADHARLLAFAAQMWNILKPGLTRAAGR